MPSSALTLAPFLASPIDLLPLALLGGVLGLDVVSFPQAMFSRPIVAATLGGAFAGAPVAGLMCGAAMECLALEALPVGASRYPEWGSASVVAGVVAAYGVGGTQLPRPGLFALAVAIGIMTSWVGGLTMVQHRRLIAAWARPRLDQLASGTFRTVVALQVFGLTVDVIRGALLTLVALVPTLLLAGVIDAHWTVSEGVSRGWVVVCVAAVAATAVWKDFHAIRYTRRLFVAALLVGTAGVLLGV